MANKVKSADAPLVHHCTAHGKEAKAVKHLPENRIRFDCPDGCSLSKNETVRKHRKTS